jgi:hypothetical protein
VESSCKPLVASLSSASQAARSGTVVVAMTILAAHLSPKSYTGLAYERTQVALAAFRRVMDEGPTFGDSLEKVQRWDRQCLAAAMDVREAFWRDSGAEARTRDAYFTLTVEEVRRAVDLRSKGQ